MAYPVGPLLRTLAERILKNLDLIDDRAPKWGDPDQNEPPYMETQLLISLLGVLVFPNERNSEALGKLLEGYEDLSQVLTIRYPREGATSVEIFGAQDQRETIDPSQISSLPRLLRNSIAHFCVRPIDKDGRFGGIRIWNKDLEGTVTFVADMDFDNLRPLARHILQALASAKPGLELDDPEDPLDTLRDIQRRKEMGLDGVATPKRRKPPRVTANVWDELMGAHEGNYNKAKMSLDKLLARETQRLRVGRKEGRRAQD
jgi:hypothetical protein